MNIKIQFLIFHVDKGQTINDECLDAIEREVAEKSGDHLYLVMQTYGGSPFSAVSIMNILQNKFKKISALIPKYAKSAGTLMVLGTDVIYMNVRSALGPLDLPVEHPRDGSRISALDIKNAVVEISTLSNLIAMSRYKALRDDDGENDIGISKLDAATLAFQTATDLVKPIIEKVDPYHLNKSMRELRIVRDYAVDLLMSRMMKGNFEKAIKIATRFVNIFPAHEYSIFSKEAKGLLQLTVENLESLEEWKIIKDDVQKISNGKDYVISYKEKDYPSSEVSKSSTVTHIPRKDVQLANKKEK
jgi:hypothetical protein